MNDFLIKLLNKKVLFSLVFLCFTIFWISDFFGAIACFIALPLLSFITSKNNSDEKGGAFKDYNFVAQTTLIIGISYFVFMVQYLSIPNTNKLIQTQELQKGSYYIPEYKSARPRPDSALLLKNDKGGQVVDCSFVHWGNCPHYNSYNNDIYVEFITPKRNFRQIILGERASGVAYYIHYKDTITDKASFIKKYNDEFKSIYLFLISLNIYMLFLLYIKYSYDIQIRHSFKVVFSKFSDGATCVFLTLFHCLYLFVFFIV